MQQVPLYTKGMESDNSSRERGGLCYKRELHFPARLSRLVAKKSEGGRERDTDRERESEKQSDRQRTVHKVANHGKLAPG